MMNRLQALLFWLSLLLVAIPGYALLYMKYGLKPLNAYSVVNHPWQPMALHAHVLMAPLLVFAFGVLSVNHILPRFDSELSDGRKGGIAMALLFWPMVASGYFLQVTTSEAFRKTMVWTHIGTSALFTLLIIAHFIHARNYRSRQT